MGKNWRAGLSKKVAVTACNTLSRRLNDEYALLGTWSAVGIKFNISRAMAFRVANGYEPKRADIRAALGLPCYAPAPVCPKHGIPHPGKCPRKKTFEQNAADYADWLKVNAGKLAEWVGEYRSRTE